VAVHNCYTRIDRKLKKLNTRLTRNLFDRNHLVIATEPIKKLRGKKAKVVIATYCPFCGEKVVDQ
jgi:hypothetical protein